MKQTYENLEVIVVDDASTDNSVDVIKSFRDSRVKLIQNSRNLGGSASFNLALTLCEGKYIANLDSDDSHHPDKTRASIEILESKQHISVVGTYTNALTLLGEPHEKQSELEQFTAPSVDINHISAWIGSNYLSRSSSVVRKSAYDSMGGSDTAMNYAPDYELWTRLLAAGHQFVVIPERLTNQSIHSGSVTHSNPDREYLELCYSMARNLAPLAFAKGQHRDFQKIISWASNAEPIFNLQPREANFAVGNLVSNSRFQNFRQFLSALESGSSPVEKVGIYLRYQNQLGLAGNGIATPGGIEQEKAIETDAAVIANNLITSLPSRGALRNLLNLLRQGKRVAFVLSIFGYKLLALQQTRIKFEAIKRSISSFSTRNLNS